jgi:D-alanyl-lipoteichoic acid acyltransferase DltB (MBOAT superfamily)
MLFNSGTFALFFSAFVGLYWLVRNSLTGRNRLILAASWLFYGWWDWRFLGLLIASSLLDHRLGIAVEESSGNRRRRLVAFSVAINLGLLGFFKYAGFFADSMAALIRSLGGTPDWPTLNIVLPVGISFYTFQSLGYVLDIDNGRVKACRDRVQFLAYVAFFPQLVAGPIERASRLLPQFQTLRTVDAAAIRTGLWWVILGLFRKVAVADPCGALADIAFGQEHHTTAGVLLGVTAFALQIYGDFAGYSDMARGLARLLGFDLMENFALPYFADGLRSFWRRWHISLSEWLRDNVYIPLGGNRFGLNQTLRNLLLTMVIGGLWHGAAWHFVAWGAWHGTALALALLVRTWTPRLPSWGRRLGVLAVVGFGWLLFRAPDLDSAWSMTRALADGTAPVWARSGTLHLIWFATPLLLLDGFQARSGTADWGAQLGWVGRYLLQGLLIYGTALAWRQEPATFLYFQF